MNIEDFRAACLAKQGSTEDTPFDQNTLVFKVMGKIFALISIAKPDSCNLKCDPERAIELREQYAEVEPGYHMSKKHWNTVRFGGSLKEQDILTWLDDSYQLVVNGLTKKQQQELSIER